MKPTPILSFLIVVLCSIAVSGQESATTASGRKVILSPDGTWRNAELPKPASPSSSGNCDQWLLTTTDKVTGNRAISGKAGFLLSDDGKSGMRIITMKLKESVILALRVAESGTGCIDEASRVYFLFRDGSRLILNHRSKFNCDGDATLYFGGVFGGADNLAQLKTKEVETIRVETRKSSVTRDLTPEQSRRLIGELSCLDAAKDPNR